MTASVWQQPPRLRADLVIVGGGVIGTATAWALRRLAPDRQILLLDAERLAHGASGRNAGFLLLGTHADYAAAVDAYGRERARRIWAFTSEAYRLASEIGTTHDVGFSATGSLLAAATQAEADRLKASRDLLADDGVPTTYQTGAELAAQSLLGFRGGLAIPEGGAIDPARLVRALATLSGAEVREGWRVEAVASEGAGVRLDLADGGRIDATQVFVAANAYLPRLVASLAPAVRPVRAQMLATAPQPPTLATPVYSHEGYYYVRQRPDGRVLVGGARHLHEADEVGYEDVTTEALQADLHAYLQQHLPALASAEVERRWSGTMGFSPDGLPSIGDVPGVPGAVWAAGFTGHGMGYALRFGVLAARRLLGLPDPDADLFDAGRLTSA